LTVKIEGGEKQFSLRLLLLESLALSISLVVILAERESWGENNHSREDLFPFSLSQYLQKEFLFRFFSQNHHKKQ
jgi:hypothetical protein